jgi:GNAT superfamily N-acetyltransferase
MSGYFEGHGMTKISYRLDRDFDVGTWLDLYRAAEWNRDWTADNAVVMLAHAYLIVTAWREDEIPGTLTVLSDGLNYAIIDDVVVRPDHRRQGIGSQLIRLAARRVGHLQPHLEAVPGSARFYGKLGFVANTGHTPMYLPSTPAR